MSNYYNRDLMRLCVLAHGSVSPQPNQNSFYLTGLSKTVELKLMACTQIYFFRLSPQQHSLVSPGII